MAPDLDQRHDDERDGEDRRTTGAGVADLWAGWERSCRTWTVAAPAPLESPHG
jgi:hypothetical protein